MRPRPPRIPRAAVTVRTGALAVLAAVAVLQWEASVFFGSAQTQQREPRPAGAALAGRPAPDFTLPLILGRKLTLHRLRGKTVVLIFWASWCVPCREEMLLLVRLQKLYQPRGMVFVGVDVQDQERDAIAFIKQAQVDYAVVRARDETVMNAYSVRGLPTTTFIRADGVVADVVLGAFMKPEGEQALRAQLDDLLRGAKR